MTAAEYQSIAADAATETARIQSATARLTFDPSAPLPPLKPHPRTLSWEPAARHYRDIEPEEKAQA